LRSETSSVNRTFQPTVSSPSVLPSSSAIRAATVRAASRRGLGVARIRAPPLPTDAPAQLQADLGQLGSSCPSRFSPATIDHLVVPDRLGDVSSRRAVIGSSGG